MARLNEQATPKQRVALYGGAFDPVHMAHIGVALAASEQYQLDRVVFIPVAQSPLKNKAPVASDAQRLRMLELATAEHDRFVVDNRELRRGGLSYTVDTVRGFVASEPEAELFLIIGADQLEQIDQWHSIEALAEMVTFLVLARPGYELSPPPVVGLVWREVKAALMEVSSTAIRDLRRSGGSLGEFVPKAVETFIEAEGLYT
ncbi:MAG: nicotinate-nucleotide adenylyltransferase [Opitutales bacterium]